MHTSIHKYCGVYMYRYGVVVTVILCVTSTVYSLQLPYLLYCMISVYSTVDNTFVNIHMSKMVLFIQDLHVKELPFLRYSVIFVYFVGECRTEKAPLNENERFFKWKAASTIHSSIIRQKRAFEAR